ncbi:MAG: DICT sensory domain-containing protein [Candidatus Limnocylindria bacterium]
MDWTYPTSSDERRAQGIAEIAERLVSEVGDRQLEGTRFTYDAREMLRATREIEGSLASGGRLWVGFQRASKLEHECERYAAITSQGADVVAFGTGEPTLPPEVSLRWVALEPTTDRLENQWFLITTAPEPIGFVSWEVSDPDRFGEGGISAPDKRFVGFVTSDRRVIDDLVDYLDSVAKRGSES